MMNMGGPSTLPEVHEFLSRLFHDRDLIPLPLQSLIAPWIAKRRTPQIEKQYAAIGGGSPILRWTRHQGQAMIPLLDELSPETAPHKAYVAFRYARPYTEDCMDEMRRDGVTRAVAFTQYPQYSCSTTGSSLNEVWRWATGVKSRPKVGDEDVQMGMPGVEWSVIDRWFAHPGLVEAFARNIETALEHYDPSTRDSVVLLFSAHSLPMSVVNRGDPYVLEVSSTVSAVMHRLGNRNPYRLVWQSQVGPSAWMGPQTNDALKGLARLGKKKVCLVPIAFTSDHIETLFELDHEYAEEAKQLGIDITRAESLNGSPVFARAIADIAAAHLKEVKRTGQHASVQMGLRCPGCKFEHCGKQKEWFANGGR
ncbi:ferrochelatase [Dacryopinax primogenitus]|uniref:Ferrochelatase n=1 Tax=Dacryopinax primogenitus (strain DJM 731) TaxID=1858805 RepID=M5G5L5_DACPD|nr:ferrochelatase [Dacryopinax primogenitus]EJU03994.1 ferrochelatase [Dacryopinax primogenitus]